MSLEQKQQSSLYVLFGVIFTLIGLAALVALVIVRSHAQTPPNINQVAGVPLTYMTVDSEGLFQDQGGSQPVDLSYQGSDWTNPDCPGAGCPLHTPAILTPGAVMSAPMHLIAHITAPNGVANTILTNAAELHVFAVFSSDPNGPAQQLKCEPFSGRCGDTLWTEDVGYALVHPGAGHDLPRFAGAFSDTISNFITVDPADPTKATIDVPIALPYYASPDEWSVDWWLDPTDANGNVDYDHELSTCTAAGLNVCLSRTAPSLFFQAGHLVAMNVTPATISYTVGGGAIQPDADSDVNQVAVEDKGNVTLNVSAYGTGWTCTTGQTMPVGITHVGMGLDTMAYTDDAAVNLGQISSGIFDAITVRDLTGITCNKSGKCDPAIPFESPTVRGDQFATPSSILALITQYQTQIHVPAGISGTCSSTLWNIARESALKIGLGGGGGGKGGGGKGGGGNGVSPGISLSDTSVFADAGTPELMRISGSHAYMLNASGEIKTIDISDIGSLSSGSVMSTIAPSVTVGNEGFAAAAISGNYLYTANINDNSMSIIDISSPSNPVELTTFSFGRASLGGMPTGIAVDGTYAYVTDANNAALLVVDVSDPYSPAVVGQIAMSTPASVQAYGGYVYVANVAGSTVSIIDVSDPTNPTLINTVGVGLYPTDIAFKQVGNSSYAIVADQGYVSVIDISVPASATLVKTVTLPDTPSVRALDSISVAGNYAYASDWNGTVSVINVTDPTNASLYGTSYMTSTPGSNHPNSVAAVGTHGFVANGGYGFQYISLP